MRAAVLSEIGQPLAVVEIPVVFGNGTFFDDEIGLKQGQVLIQVLCAGICGSQLQEIDGIKGDPTHCPHLLGHEGCGIVRGIRADSDGKIKVGDKVVMHWRKGSGMDVSEGGTFHGIRSGPVTTFSEYTIVSENRVTPIPDDVPNDLAALLGCALSTALALVENEADVPNTKTAFVIGCGGLGLALILALKAAGVKHVFATDINEGKLPIVDSLKANFLFNQAAGFDLVIDTTGQFKHLATGRYISLQKGGSEGGGFNPDKDIPRYVQMWRDGKLDDYSKLITHRIKLDDINKGIQLMRHGKAGRVMIEL